jgi:hypothetical protein
MKNVPTAGLVYPPRSRVGLVPPTGMVFSKSLTGFEDPSGNADIILLEAPAEAYASFDKHFTPECLTNLGFMVLPSSESLRLGALTATLMTETAPDRAGFQWMLLVKGATVAAFIIARNRDLVDRSRGEQIRDALKTVALRSGSISERMAALPFQVRNKAGFLPLVSGDLLILLEEPSSTSVPDSPAVLAFFASEELSVAGDEQRDQLAREVLNYWGSGFHLKDAVIEHTHASPSRHEMMVKAMRFGNPMIAVQTITFGANSSWITLGLAKAERQDEILPRFRAVIDSVEMKP